MKGLILMIAAFILPLNVLLAQSNDAQGRGQGSRDSRLYDPKSVVKIEGTITDIQNYSPEGTGRNGIHIKLKTNKKTMNVHLGPSWYIDKQDVKLNINDKITVTGSEVTYSGSKVIIASKVEKGKKILDLRDTNGIPLWSGKGRQ